MPTNVLVLGGSGMLGAMVTDFLARQPGLRVSATVRAEDLKRRCEQALPAVSWRLFDAAALDPARIEQTLEGQAWVINAVGVIKPYIHDDNAAEVERAVRINALFPHLLARAAEKTGSRVLQIATDCVYSGQKGRYVETDKHDALDAYGKTKSLGEVTSKQVFHLRCSIIGPELKAHLSLLDWFLGQPQGAKVNGFVNHRWNGVTTLHYAKLCLGVIAKELDLSPSLHIIPTGDINKCELLQCYARHYGREDITIGATEAAVVVDRTLATRNAKLNQEAWAAAGYTLAPSVPQMVEELAAYRWQFERP
jgi:dTDP-4-dehydrorhamnose reductase